MAPSWQQFEYFGCPTKMKSVLTAQVLPLSQLTLVRLFQTEKQKRDFLCLK